KDSSIPFVRCHCAGGNIFFCFIERVLTAILVRPVCRPNFKCLSSEQKVKLPAEQFPQYPGCEFIRVRDYPPSEFKAAARVFIRRAGACITPSSVMNSNTTIFLI